MMLQKRSGRHIHGAMADVISDNTPPERNSQAQFVAASFGSPMNQHGFYPCPTYHNLSAFISSNVLYGTCDRVRRIISSVRPVGV